MRILTVVDYDEMWPTLFENERTLLQMTLGKVISRVHHIGSTSVPGLSAKPVIDILIEVANLEELDSLNQAMEGVGYTVRGENGILNRRYFTKGGNQRSHHIHAFATGDAQIIKHLAFRDYLIKHNDVAIQYALMKKARCYYVKMTATDTAFIKRISFRNIFVWRLLMRVTWASLQINYNPCFFVIFHSVTSCFSIISKQHALQTTCGFLQLSILNKRRGDKADNASFSMEALFHNPSGLASCMNSIRRRSPVGSCRRLE